MRQSIFKLSGEKTVLSGSVSGRNLLSMLIGATAPTGNPEIIFLDFGNIEVATASFLRESIIAFRNFARDSMQTMYPVVANASPLVIEELQFFLRQTADTMWRCNLTENDVVQDASILGELEPAQKEAFEIVKQLQRTSAPALAASEYSQGIKATAWNNRLSALSAKGLVIERRDGKTKTFSPVLESV